ncbi:MAG TPA: diguanylate cyclase, partial [Gammaproteobacteria bacterium]|nr:diguanylate cyclase [Gammaproteobacteria bacterium]
MPEDRQNRFNLTAVSLYVVPVVVWALLLLFSFNWNLSSLKESTRNLATEKGRMVFSVIEATREWNAKHGGVYVPVTGQSPSNPYLVVEEKDFKTPSGRALTMINPAYMTRQLAGIMAGTRLNIHLTSLKPLNPGNKATEWERLALESFERGKRERLEIVPSEKGLRFSYMAPLLVKKVCLQCHAVQGYKEGDIRGGIHVSFPVAGLYRAEERAVGGLFNVHLIVFVLLSLLSSVAVFRTEKLVTHLKQEREQRDAIIEKKTQALSLEIEVRKRSEAKLKQLSTTDELTGIGNRRVLTVELAREFSRSIRYLEPLSVMMMDLDKFKVVNDQYGHEVGDRVLKHFASQVQGFLRETDLFARYGGEEFTILMPGTGAQGGGQLAERIRQAVSEMEVPVGLDEPISVT